jgi:tetratricopeptide (TPR) repeat protein
LLPNDWEPIYWRGCAEGTSCEYQAAEISFTALLKLVPDQRCAYLQRGHVRYHLGSLDAAFRDYLEAERRGTLTSSEVMVLAALQIDRREYAGAEEILAHLSTQGHNSEASAILLGRAREHQGKLHEAAKSYILATQIEPATAAWERLAIVFTKLQSWDRALGAFGHALRQGRPSDALLYHVGWACYHRQQFSVCIDAWTRLFHRHPERQRLSIAVNRVKYLWACEFVRQGDLEAAIPLWTDYVSKHPDDEPASRGLAELHFRVATRILAIGTESGDKAIAHLETARRVVPDDWRLVGYLGFVKASLGDSSHAAELLDHACKLQPQQGRFLYHLALSLWANGTEQQAESKLRQLIAKDDDYVWAQRATYSLAVLLAEKKRLSEAADLLLRS